jgi:hypothetical protein
MRGPIQNALRLFTRVMRPLALKNVLGNGSAVIVANGREYEVDQPEVMPMAEATAFFRPREQRMHRQFRVESALRVRFGSAPPTHY